MADFDDPVNFLDIFKDREQGTNNTGWEHPKYVEALGQSVLCSTEEARKEYLRQAESLLMDQMPIIPIFHYALNFLKNEELDDVTVSDIGQIDFRWSTLQRQGL